MNVYIIFVVVVVVAAVVVVMNEHYLGSSWRATRAAARRWREWWTRAEGMEWQECRCRRRPLAWSWCRTSGKDAAPVRTICIAVVSWPDGRLRPTRCCRACHRCPAVEQNQHRENETISSAINIDLLRSCIQHARLLTQFDYVHYWLCGKVPVLQSGGCRFESRLATSHQGLLSLPSLCGPQMSTSYSCEVNGRYGSFRLRMNAWVCR